MTICMDYPPTLNREGLKQRREVQISKHKQTNLYASVMHWNRLFKLVSMASVDCLRETVRWGGGASSSSCASASNCDTMKWPEWMHSASLGGAGAAPRPLAAATVVALMRTAFHPRAGATGKGRRGEGDEHSSGPDVSRSRAALPHSSHTSRPLAARGGRLYGHCRCATRIRAFADCSGFFR